MSWLTSISSALTTVSSGISTFKEITGKVENVCHALGVLDDDMVLLDLLTPALDILVDDMKDEILDGISYYMWL
jgi:hypothetical protein